MEKSNTFEYAKSPEQKIMELKAKVKLLEKQAFVAYKKAIIFDMMIDIAEKECQFDIRKHSSSEQSIILNTTKTNNNVCLYFVQDR